MEQFIGNLNVQSSDSNSEVIEEAISLTEIHVQKSPKKKEFVFHRGCSFNLTSILKAGLIAGGREGRETRHAVFFTSVNHEVPKKKNILMISRNPEKSIAKQVGSPLKTLFIGSVLGGYKRMNCVWASKSHAIITNITVSLDCVERVISQR